jgi:Domain of unknown function (DUF6894)
VSGTLPQRRNADARIFALLRQPSRGARRALRYFFHVTGSVGVLKDEEGQSFSSLDEAKGHAIVIASELAGDETYHGWVLWVTDDQGNEVARVAIGATT